MPLLPLFLLVISLCWWCPTSNSFQIARNGVPRRRTIITAIPSINRQMVMQHKNDFSKRPSHMMRRITFFHQRGISETSFSRIVPRSRHASTARDKEEENNNDVVVVTSPDSTDNEDIAVEEDAVEQAKEGGTVSLPVVLDELAEPSDEDVAATIEEFGLDQSTIEADEAGEDVDKDALIDPINSNDILDGEEAEAAEEEPEEDEEEPEMSIDELMDKSDTFNNVGQSLAEIAMNASAMSPGFEDPNDEALWQELVRQREQRLAILEPKNNKPQAEVNLTQNLLYRDGKFIRPLPESPPLTEEQDAFLEQFCLNGTKHFKRNVKTAQGQRVARRLLYQYPDMLIPTTINSTVLLPMRRKGFRIYDIIELKAMIQRVVENRVIEVIEDKMMNETYLPMDTSYSQKVGIGYLVKDEEEHAKAELAVALNYVHDAKEVTKFLNRENLAKYREMARSAAANTTIPTTGTNETKADEYIGDVNVDSLEVLDGDVENTTEEIGDDGKDVVVLPIDFDEQELGELTPEERAMLNEDHRLRKIAAKKLFTKEFAEYKRELAEEEEELRNASLALGLRKPRRNKALEEWRTPDNPFPTAREVVENEWSELAMGPENALMRDSGLTLAQRLTFLDERHRNQSLERLEAQSNIAIILKPEKGKYRRLKRVPLLKKRVRYTRKTKLDPALERLLEAPPPRERIYVRKRDLGVWAHKVFTEYKDAERKVAAINKLKTPQARERKGEELTEFLSTKFNLEASVKTLGVSVDEIRKSLNRLIRNDTVTESWIEAFEELAVKIEANDQELTEDDELTMYVFSRALDGVERDVQLILNREYLDKNVTHTDIIEGHHKYVPFEYPSMEDARHPVLHAQKIIQEEVKRNGGDPLKLEPLPFSIPYDKYFQRPLAEVYAAVTNSSTNSSMVGIAERLLNHIREATNHSERIAYKLLIFGERREGIIPPQNADSIQVWVEGHTVFHLVDGVSIKTNWGCIPEQVLFSPKNLDLIVEQVRKCALETELGGQILSPYENSKRSGKQDTMASMPIMTALNYHEQLPQKFSTVNG